MLYVYSKSGHHRTDDSVTTLRLKTASPSAAMAAPLLPVLLAICPVARCGSERRRCSRAARRDCCLVRRRQLPLTRPLLSKRTLDGAHSLLPTRARLRVDLIAGGGAHRCRARGMARQARPAAACPARPPFARARLQVQRRAVDRRSLLAARGLVPVLVLPPPRPYQAFELTAASSRARECGYKWGTTATGQLLR